MSKKDDKFKNDKNLDSNAVEEVSVDSASKDDSSTKHMALDDARRIKVLSPSMLVFKRFIRNKLAITGSIILIFMFMFAFLGGLVAKIAGYSEIKTYDKDSVLPKPYAQVKDISTEMIFTYPDGGATLGTDNAEVIQAITTEYKYSNGMYSAGRIYKIDSFENNDDFCLIYLMTEAATVEAPIGNMGGDYIFRASTAADDELISNAAFQAAYGTAVEKEDYCDSKDDFYADKVVKYFTYDDVEYRVVVNSKKNSTIYKPVYIGYKGNHVFDATTEDYTALIDTYDFRYDYEIARGSGETSFVLADGTTYTIKNDPIYLYTAESKDDVADVESEEFEAAFTAAKASGAQTFVYNEVTYNINFVEYRVSAYKDADDAFVESTGFTQKVIYYVTHGIEKMTYEGKEYSVKYDKDRAVYNIQLVVNGKGSDFGKAELVNSCDITYVDEEGNTVNYAYVTYWDGDSILQNGVAVAYVCTYRVIPDASRGGLELSFEFKQLARKACGTLLRKHGEKYQDFLMSGYVLEDQVVESIQIDEESGESFLTTVDGDTLYVTDEYYKFLHTDNDGMYIFYKETIDPKVTGFDGSEFYDKKLYIDTTTGDVSAITSQITIVHYDIAQTDEVGMYVMGSVDAGGEQTKLYVNDGFEAYISMDESGNHVFNYCKASMDTSLDESVLAEEGKYYVEGDAYVLGGASLDADGNVVNAQKLYISNDYELYLTVDDNGSYVLSYGEGSIADGIDAETAPQAGNYFIDTTETVEIVTSKTEGAISTIVDYNAEQNNDFYTIWTPTDIRVLDVNAAPSAQHWLGTDSNSMDNFTRIMYGGRISLMVGFVVIFLEMFIGVIFGGVSGYFGGITDTIMMRFVDLFNCIPYWPMMLIGGSLMDAYGLNGSVRIFVLVGIMGILGWTGTARIVRGQILSLREQDFMIATEATGIRVSRRIFRHLIPNVMPLLIVQATMGLGSIIISEATLSFLGLGVQFPQASWGSIINSIKSAYDMTTYWYVWIPTGMCIMLAVLGFNFVGDGLRDAFDPKMKR